MLSISLFKFINEYNRFLKVKVSDHVVQKLFTKGLSFLNKILVAQDKVVVIKGDGCFAKIGRRGGDQVLALIRHSFQVGFAVHEIGHALGFFHTMSRFDRDKYIRIIVDNLDTYGMISQSWTRLTLRSMDSVPFYQKTMGSEIISFSDIFVINQHYKCEHDKTWENRNHLAKCDMGFPHPRNCSICICPGGYGGALCDQRVRKSIKKRVKTSPTGCGKDLAATTEKQIVNQRLGSGSDLREDVDYKCIQAPEGKKIEVDVLSMSRGYDKGGLLDNFSIISTNSHVFSPRFCSSRGTWSAIVSSSNVVPVILFNRFGTMETNFTYRYID
ncbi:unnamed protein product [Angiostrongylus costaricensis]|uniref:Metalloendopeptidase n=1 Tax=Angiostrongylus costaricensis TaxID=334426 RepID=A0A3P7HJ66_ANGCS|nr:unnamed protein product [Angiostrongylus costaricensis]